jgi:non-haem Fe2+, alpha-ketoglutarate-dependent halogenase
MPRVLSAEAVERYDRDGYLFPIDVFPASEIARLRAAFEETRICLHGDNSAQARGGLHLRCRWLYDLMLDSAILDVVEDVIGPEFLALSTIVFFKPPRDDHFVSWHQDGRFIQRVAGESPAALTAWIALTDSTVENGNLRVIPGSHRLGRVVHNDTYAPGNLLRRGETVEMPLDEGGAVDMLLRAGQMSLHHVDTIHGSNPNRSEADRVGVAIRYMHPQLQLTKNDSPVVMARGCERPGHYQFLPQPPTSDIAEGVAAHLEAIRRAAGTTA